MTRSQPLGAWNWVFTALLLLSLILAMLGIKRVRGYAPWGVASIWGRLVGIQVKNALACSKTHTQAGR